MFSLKFASVQQEKMSIFTEDIVHMYLRSREVSVEDGGAAAGRGGGVEQEGEDEEQHQQRQH